MKMKLRERAKFLKPTRFVIIKFLPLLIITTILLLSVGVGIADPTSLPPPPPIGTGT